MAVLQLVLESLDFKRLLEIKVSSEAPTRHQPCICRGEDKDGLPGVSVEALFGKGL